MSANKYVAPTVEGKNPPTLILKNKNTYLATGGLLLLALMVAATLIFFTGGSPGIDDPATQRMKARQQAKEKSEQKANDLMSRFLTFDFSPNYLGENVDPGILQIQMAQHARSRRLDIENETHRPNSVWRGRSYDALADYTIDENIRKKFESIFTKHRIIVQPVDENSKPVGSPKYYSPSMHQMILVMDSLSIVMSQYMSTDTNLKSTDVPDDIDVLFREFQESRARYLSINGNHNAADELRAREVIQKEVREDAYRRQQEKRVE